MHCMTKMNASEMSITNISTMIFIFWQLHLTSYPCFRIFLSCLALELFYELRNDRQAAAAHYQLGSFYSSYWPLYPSRSDALLEKALLHYREAHGYYSKYDVGPTLLLILIDMCDLYLSAYSATEPFLKPNGVSGASEGTIASAPQLRCGQVLLEEGTLETPDGNSDGILDGVKGTPEGASGETTIPRPDITQPPSSSSDLVVALLGGALQSLLESRFAFTPAVAERSRYRSEILLLASDIAKRLGSVLLKVLKAHARGYLPCLHSAVPVDEGDKSRDVLTDGPPSCTAQEGSLATSSTPSASVPPSEGEEMVLEARRVCSELLRWSNTTQGSSPRTSVSVQASAVAGTGGGGGSISVNRLYELIDTVNQNDWLRKCATANK